MKHPLECPSCGEEVVELVRTVTDEMMCVHCETDLENSLAVEEDEEYTSDAS